MLETFIAKDRRRALSNGVNLQDRQTGSALFADISGFTPLAEVMAEKLGRQRGSEALANALKLVFDVMVDAVDRAQGTVVSFVGDAIVCWFDADDGERALDAAVTMQRAVARVGGVDVPGGDTARLALKVSVAAGSARRFQIGEPGVQLLDCLAGELIDRLATGERLCRPGDIIVDAELASALAERVTIQEWRQDDNQARFAVVSADPPRLDSLWPEQAEHLPESILSAWVAPIVRAKIRSGDAALLTEFRPVTSVFVNFSGINYDSDPNAGDKLDQYVRWAMTVVGDFGGRIHDIVSGDKGNYFFAAFGAPVAHDDDVRRAVSAADLLRHLPPELPHIEKVRIGVNTGTVYTGVYDGTTRRTYTILGDSVNLAARLMGLAEPGEVIVSGAVALALDRHFQTEPLEPVIVKGRKAPVPICRLLGTTELAPDLEEPRYALPLVGREDVLETFDSKFQAALGGRGGVVGLRGEAGIGKSRLLSEVMRRAAAAGFQVLAGESRSFGAARAYSVWRPVFLALLGVGADGSTEERAERAVAALASLLPPLAFQAPVLDALLGLPIPANDFSQQLPPFAKKEVALELAAHCVHACATSRPLCIILEDSHWIDTLSRELLFRLAQSLEGSAVLIVLAYRPSDTGVALFEVPWLEEIRLGALGSSEVSRLIAHVAAQVLPEVTQVPSAFVERIATIAEGNPFYVEELLRFVAQLRVDLRNPIAVAGVELPESLHSLILERIDGLTSSQQTAIKVASVIGRRFGLDWLVEAFPRLLEGDARKDIYATSERRLVMPDAEQLARYLFTHIVIHDVVYDSLSHALRERLHEQLAGYIERIPSEQLQVDLLVFHYSRSANFAKEAEYRTRAAELAIQHGDYEGALLHVRRALAIRQQEAPGPERTEAEVELNLLLGTILLVVSGQGSQEVKDTYDRAWELVRELPPGPTRGRALFGLWTFYLFQGLMHEAGDLIEDILALAEATPDPSVRAIANFAASQTNVWAGDWEKCVEHMARVLEGYDPSQHRAYLSQYAQNPRFTVTAGGFWALHALGRPEEASLVIQRAIDDATPLNHDFTLAIASLGRAVQPCLQRDAEGVRATIDDYLLLAERAGNPFYLAMARTVRAWLRVVDGDTEAGLTALVEQREVMRRIGVMLVDAWMTALIAEAHLRVGKYEDGLAMLDAECPAHIDKGRVAYQGEYERLRADLILARDPTSVDDAEKHYREALRLAQTKQAKAHELRAAVHLGRLLRANDRSDEARELLLPLFETLTQGRDAPDMLEAVRLLTP